MLRREQTITEERANYITHALGILFSVVSIPFMVVYAVQKGSVSTLWGVSVFGFAMVMVYCASTIYHAVKQNTDMKRMLRIWDHIGIFVMIGGSYTPVVLKYTDAETSFVFLTTMWSVIAVGSVLKLFFTGKYILFEVILYVLLGWMVVFIIKPLIANMPAEIFLYVLTSGILYSIGVVFYLWKNLSYHHAVWHVFVLAGSVTHFFAVYNSIPIHVKI